MIRFLLDLSRVGQLLIESNRVPDPITSEINSYYLCEISDPEIQLTYHATPLVVPKRQAKGSGLNCDFFDENLKFFKGTRDLKGTDPFWTQCLQSLGAAGELEILAAVRDFRTRLDEYDAVLASTSSTNERFYFLVHQGNSTPNRVIEKITHRNMDSLGVYSDAITIVMTYHGVPITGTTRVMAWWRSRCASIVNTPRDLDIVKGEYCHPSRLIERIRFVDTPLVSFNLDSPAFEFENLSQAFNFPVSQETQTQFNTGFSWIVRRNGGQSVILSKVGPSTVEIGWWPEGVIEHPILAPLVAILHGAKKKPVAEAWEALEKLTVDSTPINFAAWFRSKSRFSLADQWSVPADDLRKALLKFHDEFGQTGYDPVRWFITCENKKSPPTLHPSCFLPTFKAVVTGSAYPDQIAVYYYNNSQKWSTGFNSLWIDAYLSRRFGTPMAKDKFFRLNLEPIRKHYEPGESANTPTLLTFVGDHIANMEKPSLSAFKYGLLLALYGKIKQLYHWGVSKKFINVGDIPTRFRYPRQFFQSEAGKLARYHGWLEANQRTPLFQVVSQYLSEYQAEIDPTTMSQSISGQPVYINMGWGQCIAYLQELSNFTNQMQAYQENGLLNPSKKSEGSTRDAAQ